MDRVFELRWVTGRLVKESKAHRVMCVSDRKSCWVMKKTSCRRNESLKKNHRRHGRRSQELVIVIESLRSSSGRSGKKRLVVTRQFSIVGEPLCEIAQNMRDLIVRTIVRSVVIRLRADVVGKASAVISNLVSCGGREGAIGAFAGMRSLSHSSERYRPSENSLDLGGVLSLLKTKAVDLLEAEKGAKNRSQFFHLFAPMKTH